MHVSMANEAVCIGPARAQDSYLRGDHVLEVSFPLPVTTIACPRSPCLLVHVKRFNSARFFNVPVSATFPDMHARVRALSPHSVSESSKHMHCRRQRAAQARGQCTQATAS